LSSSDRITVQSDPYNAETPLSRLAARVTATDSFYVRNHFDVPSPDPRDWRLVMEGAVETCLSLSLPEIQALPVRRLRITLECAGNGRTLMRPAPASTPWALGAVSTADFAGASLGALLDRAGPRADTVELLFTGADQGEVGPGSRIAFERSLPLAECRRDEVLLAWEMNGEPLRALHGFPLRLVVPRWYGVASVKWLTRITALTQPFRGYFQSEHYVYRSAAGAPGGEPVSRMRVRSLIAAPSEGDVVSSSPAEISGVAWSGDAPVSRVEVSADGGLTWNDATLDRPDSNAAWTAWRFAWRSPAPGARTLMARATDARGNVQPMEPVWNALGYGNNVVQRVQVTVRPGSV
jgi:DMSO/TMAO reductase YedYZ molybdopterin-dependent catalytic subunit